MIYGKLPKVSKPVSRIVFGCAIEPMLKGRDCLELLDKAYESGINAFDTAAAYGLSELSLGRWIRSRDLRDRVVVISKCAHPDPDTGKDRLKPEDIASDFSRTQESLGIDRVDVYLLHRDDLKVEVGPIVESLNELHDRGAIGAFGASNWTHGRIAEANEYAKSHGLLPFSVSSPNYGLAEQIGDPWGMGAGCVTISGPGNEGARRWYRENGMPILAYSSLGRGLFSGKLKSALAERAEAILDPFAVKGYCYPPNFERLARVERLAGEKACSVPQLAIAWMFQQELDVYAIVSSTKPQTVAENCAALEIALSRRECDWLDLGSPEP